MAGLKGVRMSKSLWEFFWIIQVLISMVSVIQANRSWNISKSSGAVLLLHLVTMIIPQVLNEAVSFLLVPPHSVCGDHYLALAWEVWLMMSRGKEISFNRWERDQLSGV